MLPLRNNIIGLFIFLSYGLLAQQIADFSEISNQYHNADLVTLKNHVNIDIQTSHDQLIIQKKTLRENIFLNEFARKYAKGNVSYSTFYRLEKIKAETEYLENGKYQKIEIDDFFRKNEIDRSFHDDITSLNFVYPKMGVGSITRLETTEQIMNPRFLGSFFFGNFHPILNSKLQITVSDRIKLKFKKFNFEDFDVQYSKESKKGITVHTWEVSDVRKYESELNTPNFKNYIPHIYPIIEGYFKDSGKFVPISSDVDDLYNWYYSMAVKARGEEPGEHLRKMVDSLTANADTDKEKVKAIYYWVQRNIKYIDYEYALGGFVPRKAENVFERKFGDCKDNSNLLLEMLRLANIKGSLAWIGTRSIPYSYAELPTPAVDNHMILQYQDGDDTYFLDATGRYQQMELPSAFTQGKEALVGYSMNDYAIIEVPVVPGNKNKEQQLSNIRIESNSLVGSSRKTYTGYPKQDVFYNLEGIDAKNDLNTYMKSLLFIGNNKYSFSNIEEFGKYDYDAAYQIDYEFEVPEVVKNLDDQILVNMNLNKKMLDLGIDRDRKTDLEYDFLTSFEYQTSLLVPEGFQISYLPEELVLDNDLISVELKYQSNDEKVIYYHQIHLKKMIIPKQRFMDFRRIVKSVLAAYKENIILEKKT